MSKKPVIVSMDPGSIKFGLARLDGKKIITSLAEVDSKGELHNRLWQLLMIVAGVLQKWQPTHVVLEKVFVRRGEKSNPQTALVIGAARGVGLISAASVCARVLGVQHARAKKLLTGTGKATKDEVRAAAEKLVTQDRLPLEDECDAIAVGCVGWLEITGKLWPGKTK